MENIKENYGDKLNEYINRVDGIFKYKYRRKKPLEEIILTFYQEEDISFLKMKKIDQNEILTTFSGFIKKEYKKRFNNKINIKPTIKIVQTNFRSMVNEINDSNFTFHYKRIVEIIYNLIFGDIGFNCEINKVPETKKEKIEYYLINEAKPFIEKNSINDKTIADFIRLNHLLFFSDDDFHFLCLQFFLIINDFIFEKYGEISNYNEYIMNFYHLYYKFMKKNNLSKFKEEILSKIAPYHYSKFSFDKNVLDGKYIAILRGDLENLINNNKRFKLKIDEDLVNNPRLLKLFNLKKIDEAKIIKFFKYSIIQENYLKYFKNTKDNFVLLVDELDYNDNKLHVFNIYFIISCGLLDKIETDSLQIFNEDNNVIILFQKYAKILIENINNIILKIKNQDNIILDNKEIFGFGKVFKTFYVLYTNLSDKKYEAERLKFDMIDNSVQKNIASNNALKINIKLNKSENDTNFSKNSEDSIQNLNKEQSYYEKIIAVH